MFVNVFSLRTSNPSALMPQFLAQRFVLLPHVQHHWAQFSVISGGVMYLLFSWPKSKVTWSVIPPAHSQQIEAFKVFASRKGCRVGYVISSLPLDCAFLLQGKKHGCIPRTGEIRHEWMYAGWRANSALTGKLDNTIMRELTEWLMEALQLRVWTRLKIIILINICS